MGWINLNTASILLLLWRFPLKNGGSPIPTDLGRLQDGCDGPYSLDLCHSLTPLGLNWSASAFYFDGCSYKCGDGLASIRMGPALLPRAFWTQNSLGQLCNVGLSYHAGVSADKVSIERWFNVTDLALISKCVQHLRLDVWNDLDKRSSLPNSPSMKAIEAFPALKNLSTALSKDSTSKTVGSHQRWCIPWCCKQW